MCLVPLGVDNIMIITDLKNQQFYIYCCCNQAFVFLKMLIAISVNKNAQEFPLMMDVCLWKTRKISGGGLITPILTYLYCEAIYSLAFYLCKLPSPKDFTKFGQFSPF